ncbi:MAG: tetratricopeptide repeat protein, partial [Alistipes finegoldii]
LYYKSYIDYAEGRYGRAKQGFTALQRSDAYRDVVPYYLLQIEFHEGNYRYVVENGGKLVQRAIPERRKELERVIAESWFRLGDFNKTIEHLDAFAAAGGELDRDGSYLMGFSLYRTARYPEAGEYLRRACGAEDALTQNASYHLADCYLRAGDKRAAMHTFAMAADDRFDATIAEDALFNYGKLQYELGGGAFNGAINVLTR